MGVGFSQGLAQVTLALFTTLAPAGMVAFCVMACVLLFGKLSEKQWERMSHFLVVPLAVAVVGFIGSATHLGKPSNALYVLAGIGRSPLSNEVIASVTFFALSGMSWYVGFSRQRWAQRLVRPGMLLACAAGAWQVWEIANAYTIRTISTWSTPSVQANLVLAALMGGALLAICSLSLSGYRTPRRLFGALLAIAGVSAAAAAVSQSLQFAELGAMRNVMTLARDLAPWYPAGIAVSAILAGCAIAVDACGLRMRGSIDPVRACAACALMFAGVFTARFAFYCLHMTVGF